MINNKILDDLNIHTGIRVKYYGLYYVLADLDTELILEVEYCYEQNMRKN